MQLSPNAKTALAVAGTGALLWVLWPSARTKTAVGPASSKPSKLPGSTPQGDVVCPGDRGKIPASLATVEPGDFVAIGLSSKDGTFFEMTWAIVDSINNARTRLLVRVSGTTAKSATAPTIHSDKHGFYYNDKIILRAACVWDVFHIHTKGIVLCGMKAAEFVGENPAILTPGGLPVLTIGQEIKLYVAPRDPTGYFPGAGAVLLDPVEVRITGFSQTGTVVEGSILSKPINTDAHGYVQGSTVYFSRDCVYKPE